MKALTLTQPWATLMALQQKRIETRSWPTSYRGEVVIHSAKAFPKWAKETCEEEPFKTALKGRTAADLPLSQGLCVVRIMGCFSTNDLESSLNKIAFMLGHKPHVNELEFGDYSYDRYLWLTEFVRPLPINGWGPVKGALGLWEWDKEAAMHENLASGETHL